MSIGAANIFTRNVWKAYVNPAVTANMAKQPLPKSARWSSRSALCFASCSCRRSLRSIYSCWGDCVSCKPFPSVVFGLFNNWFRAPALLLGWAVGLFGGCWVAWSDG